MKTSKPGIASDKEKMSMRLLPDTIERIRKGTAEAGFEKEISLFIGKLLEDTLPHIQKLNKLEGFSGPDVRAKRETLLVKISRDLIFEYVLQAHRLHLKRRVDVVEAALLLGLENLQSNKGSSAVTTKGKVLTLKTPVTAKR